MISPLALGLRRAAAPARASASLGGACRRPLSASLNGSGGGGNRPRRASNNNSLANANGASSPWWSLASIHERVATALAASLPDESLAGVHQSLSEKLDGATSIGEAIARARAKEAGRNGQRPSVGEAVNGDALNGGSEKQKRLEEEIEKKATERAEERMRLELQAMEDRLRRREEERLQKEKEEKEIEQKREAAFAQWKENAARERRLEDETREARNGLQSMNGEQASVKQQEEVHHPVLGRQIAKLPYKRIHLTPAATLASLPVYEKQRAYRHDRARLMFKEKKTKTLWMGIPGVISLMEDDDGRLSILDGQHRVGMMSLLEEEQRRAKEKFGGDGAAVNGSGKSNKSGGGGLHEELAGLDLERVLVEVFVSRPANENDDSVGAGGQTQLAEDAAAAIFTEINKAEPVKLLDLPGVTNKRIRDIIDHAASHFNDAFPDMFSSSQRCRAPHLNLDNLRDQLFASEVINREKMGSGGELVRWMKVRNEELRERYGAEAGEGAGVELESGKKLSGAALKKARTHDFYLGLESTWLYK